MPLLFTGCVLPAHYRPQGFSSTYYKELQKVASIPPAPVLSPGLGEAARVGSSRDTIPVPKPIQAEDVPQRLDTEPVTTGSGDWWSWVRRPLTFRSAAAADRGDEFENDADETPARR